VDQHPYDDAASAGDTASAGHAASLDTEAQRPERWRGSRPLCGALLMIAAGIELLAANWSGAAARIPAQAALGGPWPVLLAAGLIGCGLLTLLQPGYRPVSAVAVLFAVATLMTADIGGFLAGAFLGAAGGAVAYAWVPAAAAAGRSGRHPAGQADPATAGITRILSDAADGTTTAAAVPAGPRYASR